MCSALAPQIHVHKLCSPKACSGLGEAVDFSPSAQIDSPGTGQHYNLFPAVEGASHSAEPGTGSLWWSSAPFLYHHALHMSHMSLSWVALISYCQKQWGEALECQWITRVQALKLGSQASSQFHLSHACEGDLLGVWSFSCTDVLLHYT